MTSSGEPAWSGCVDRTRAAAYSVSGSATGTYGVGFDNGTEVTGAGFDVTGLPQGATIYVRVAALNAADIRVHDGFVDPGVRATAILEAPQVSESEFAAQRERVAALASKLEGR